MRTPKDFSLKLPNSTFIRLTHCDNGRRETEGKIIFQENAPNVKRSTSQNYIIYLKDAKVMWHVATVKHIVLEGIGIREISKDESGRVRKVHIQKH